MRTQLGTFASMIFFLLILSFCTVQLHSVGYLKRSDIAIDPTYTVHVIDMLKTADLTFHCQSKDDDLGVQHPNPGEDFHWSFKENIFATTRFFCSFQRGQQKQSFDVFNDKIRQHCIHCFWQVLDDGFYTTHDGTYYFKVYDWK
ncbi:hypothetical protein NMG60_11017390 [Bertholletia excelsa]